MFLLSPGRQAEDMEEGLKTPVPQLPWMGEAMSSGTAGGGGHYGQSNVSAPHLV